MLVRIPVTCEEIEKFVLTNINRNVIVHDTKGETDFSLFGDVASDLQRRVEGQANITTK